MKLDPYGDYIVLSPDKGYKGISAKQEFLNGRAEIRGLPQVEDTCPKDKLITRHLESCAVGERINQLNWFMNSGYLIEPGEFMKRKVASNDAS